MANAAAPAITRSGVANENKTRFDMMRRLSIAAKLSRPYFHERKAMLNQPSMPDTCKKIKYYVVRFRKFSPVAPYGLLSANTQ
jgi:hypothetical protein